MKKTTIYNSDHPTALKSKKNTRSFVKFARDGYALWSVVLDKLLKLIFLFENEK